jgi:putative transposase
MSRRPRELFDGALYHVYARGNDRALIYRDDVDRHIYLRMLEAVVHDRGWLCLAYCLMSNHLHLLIETPSANLDRGMQRLQSGFAQYFNARHERVGHLFQGRYGAVRSVSDAQVCASAAYIARNPVEALLCRRPEAWPWGSFRSIARDTAPGWLARERLLSFFGDNGLENYVALANLRPGRVVGSDPQVTLKGV